MWHAWILLGLVVLTKGQVDECADYGTLNDDVLTITAASTAVIGEACQAAITTVVLTDEVQVIANSTFLDMTALVGVTIPTSVTWIGASAFQASGVHAISADGVTYVDINAFESCPNLTHVTMNTVISLGTSAFEACSLLSSVTMPMLTLVGENAFYLTISLQSINATSVTTILRQGFALSALATIDMPALTYIGDFGLTRLPLITFNTSVVLEYIGANAFETSRLSSIDLPSTLTYIGGYAFFANFDLGTIVIRGTNVTVGADAFYDTSGDSDTACDVPVVITELYNCTDYVVQPQSPTTAVPTSASPTTASPSEMPTNAPSDTFTTLPPTTNPTTAASSDVPTDAPSDTFTTLPPTTNPTTAAPVSAAPTTRAPITSAPTTVAPVSAAPVTHAPTTLAPGGGGGPPTTLAPVTTAPITPAPVTAAPTTYAPVTAAPTTPAPVAVPTIESAPTATNSTDIYRGGVIAMIVVGSLAGAVGIGVVGYNVYITMRTTTYTQLDMYL